METEAEYDEKKSGSLPRIFSIKSVNAYGNSDLDVLEDDETELSVSSKAPLFCPPNRTNFFRPFCVLSLDAFLEMVEILCHFKIVPIRTARFFKMYSGQVTTPISTFFDALHSLV